MGLDYLTLFAAMICNKSTTKLQAAWLGRGLFEPAIVVGVPIIITLIACANTQVEILPAGEERALQLACF
jgi:hypothetical protein